MPELVEDAFTRLGAKDGGAAAPALAQQEEHVFEDLESRMFYESLPDIRYCDRDPTFFIDKELIFVACRDAVSGRIPSSSSLQLNQCLSPLRSMVPGVLLGLTTEPAGSEDASTADPQGAPRPRVSSQGGETKDRTGLSRQSNDGAAAAAASPLKTSATGGVSGTDGKPEEEVAATPSASSQLDIILNRLQHCVSRDMVSWSWGSPCVG